MCLRIAWPIFTRQSGGVLCLFAMNYDERAVGTEAVIAVEGLPDGTSIQVIDEGRAITSEAGEFRDRFAPLDVHIYQL